MKSIRLTSACLIGLMGALSVASVSARADQILIDPSKITLDLTVGSGSPFKPSSGDPGKLADEQSRVGSPIDGAGADLYTACGGSFYDCTWGSTTGAHPNGAIIDLGANYKIDRIYIYDTNGKLDTLGSFTITAGSPTSGWTKELVNDALDHYRTWKGFPNDTSNDGKGRVDDPTFFYSGVTTRYLRVINPSAGMQEIVVYGALATTTPPPAAAPPVAPPSGTVDTGASTTPIVIDSSKITLDLTVGSGSPFKPSSGEASKLADEQDLVGSPIDGTGADLYAECGGSFYDCTWASSTGAHLNGAIIDLGANYQIDRIYIYDTNGKSNESLGNFTVQAGSPTAGWTTELVSDALDYYRTWKGFPNDTSNDGKGRVDDSTLFYSGVTTRYLRVINPISSGMQEIVVYGSLVGGTPPAPSPSPSPTPTPTPSGSPSPTPPPSTVHIGTQTARSYGTAGTGSVQDFWEYLPSNYATSGKDYPVVIFFHGSGECGTNINKLVSAKGSVPNMLPSPNVPLASLPNGLLPMPEDAIVLSPHLQLNARNSCGWSSAIVKPFINWVLTQSTYKGRINLKRVYLTGLSLGGAGPLSFASTYPLDIAAISVASGMSGDQSLAPIANVPTWMYQNAYHTANPVPIGTTYGQLKAIVGSGPPMGTSLPQDGKAHTVSFDPVSKKWESWTTGQAAPLAGELTTFTALPGTGHDSWSEMYKNALMWNWMFKQTR